jgi:hypothetical protein
MAPTAAVRIGGDWVENTDESSGKKYYANVVTKVRESTASALTISYRCRRRRTVLDGGLSRVIIHPPLRVTANDMVVL